MGYARRNKWKHSDTLVSVQYRSNRSKWQVYKIWEQHSVDLVDIY